MVRQGMRQDKPKPLALVTDNYSRILKIHKDGVLMMAGFQLGRNSDKTVRSQQHTAKVTVSVLLLDQ